MYEKKAGETMTLDGFSWREPVDSQQRNGSPAVRTDSQGSHSGYYRTTSDDLRTQFTSTTRNESWQGPPPPYTGYGPHQRSGSWSRPSPHNMPPPYREHSLSQNPLRNASATHAAPMNAFVESSGYWTGFPPAPQPYGGPYRDGSGQYFHPTTREYSQGRDYSQGNSGSLPRPYAVDPAIAKTWSGQSDEFRSQPVERSIPSNPQTEEVVPRPQTISKRMTSNQNETLETKKDLVGPSVKRAALNRDNSLASNRLKAAHLPDYYNKDGKFDTEHEMNHLSDSLEQSRLSTCKAHALNDTERTSTLDNIAMELAVKPSPLTKNNRSSTLEALALDDLECDPVIRPSPLSLRSTTMESCLADLERVARGPLDVDVVVGEALTQDEIERAMAV